MRITIPNLPPGTAHALQLRSVGQTTKSEWSRNFYLTTDQDLRRPDEPENVSWVVDKDNFVAEWDAVQYAEDGSAVKIDRYELELVVASPAVTRYVAVPASSVENGRVRYVLTFDNNKTLFTTPRPVVALRVRAINSNGISSLWTTQISASNPVPGAPTGVVATATVNGVELTWTAPSDLDIDRYHVYVGATSGFTPAAGNRIYSGPGTRTTYGTTTYSTQYFKIRTVDKFGQESTDATANATPLSPFTVDTTAPAVPTGLAASATNNPDGLSAYANVSWTAVASSDLAGYVVRYRRDATSDNYTEVNVSKDNTAVRVELPFASTAYDFAVRSLDWSANYSAWSSEVTAAAPGNTAPAAVTGLTSTAGRDSIVYTWTPVSDTDLRDYEVTFSTSNTFASNNVTFKTGLSPSLTVGGLTPGTTYYARVRSVDAGGQTSAWSATHTKATVSQITPGDIGAATDADLDALAVKVDDSIKTYVTEYAVNSSESTAPTSGWSTATPTRTPGSFIWVRTVVTYHDNTTSTTNPALLTGNTGATGDTGTPAPYIELTSNTQVLTSPSGGGATSPTTATVTGTATNTTITTWEYSVDGGAFSTTVPTGVSRTSNVVTITGGTMTARTITVKASGTGASDTFTVAKVLDGAAGTAGKGISSTAVTYQVHSNGTTAPTGTWQSTPQATSPGQYLWTRTVTTYTDSTTTTAYSVAAHGTTGTAGVGITGTTVTYQVHTNGTTAPTGTWNATPQATSPGQYLWTRTVTNYSDSTSTTAYSVAAHGTTGTAGVGITGSTVTYQVHTNGTTAPTGTWQSTPQATSPGQYLWTRTVTNFSDSTSSTAYSVAAHGTTGTAGVGVTGTVVTYQVSNSGTTAPVGTWQTTPQATSPGQFLWTRTVTSYSDSSSTTAYSVAAHGTTGNPGADGYTVILSNEAMTFPGSTTAALAGTESTTVVGYKGSAQQSVTIGTITGQTAGQITAAVTNNPGTSPTITVTVTTSLTAQNGTLTVPVTIDGITINKIISWSVSRQGTAGTAATSVDIGNDAVAIPTNAAGAASSAGTITIPFSGWIGSSRAAATISAGTLPTGITQSSNTAATTSADGSLVLAYASGATIGAADSGNITLTVTCNGQTFPRLFSWSRAYAGATGGVGTSATSIDVTPDVFLVPTTAAGAASTTSSATVNVRGFVGNAASNVTALSVTSGLPSGVTATPTTGANANIVFNWTSGATIGSGANGNIVASATVNGIVFTINIGWARAIQGAQGGTGNTGVSVQSITPFFRTVTPIGAAAPSQPSGTGDPAGWTTTEPAYTANTELYRTERILYDNGTASWTPVTKVSSYAAAAQAVAVAGTKNTNFYSTTSGPNTSNAGIVGDLWYLRNTTTGLVTGIWELRSITGGTTYNWSAVEYGDQVVGNLSAGTITTGTLGAATITLGTGGIIQSTNYNTTNKTGFRLTETGLDIQSGTVRASALIGDTLGSSTGTIDIGAGAVIRTNGGAIQSNTFNGTFTSGTYNNNATAGYYLDSTNGLIVATGKVTASALVAGTITGTNTITLSGANAKIVGGSWELSGSGLSIPDGGVTASKLNIQVGQNIAPYSHATMWLPLTSTPYTGTANLTVSMDNVSYNYGPQSMKIVKTGTAADVLSLTTSNANNIITPDSGRKYIVSMWVRPSVTNAMSVGLYNGATLLGTLSSAKRVTDDATTLVANTWQRVYFVTSATVSVVGMNIKVTFPTVAGTWNIDGVQVETLLDGNTSGKPSEWKPPAVTSIDGGMIKTGAIRSTETTDLTINGQTGVPLWSIPVDGSASFANLQVRGNAVIGTVGDAAATTLSSANYVPASVGYQFRSDGTADLIGIGAQTIRGESIVAGTMTLDRLRSGSMDQKIRLIGESSIYAEGKMGETVELGGEGFEVWGPHQAIITHKRIDNILAQDGVTVIGSRAYIYTSADSGYRPPAYDIDGNLVGENTGTVLVRGVGEPYDGVWEIDSFGTGTPHVQFILPNVTAPVSKAAASGILYGRDIINANTNTSKVRNIYFPSNGAEPNIISGLLTTNELTVTETATLGPTTNVPAGASIRLASGVEAPKQSAQPSFFVPSVNLGLDAEERVPGTYGMAVKDATTMYTVDYKDLGGENYSYVVNERNRVTGAVVAVRAQWNPTVSSNSDVQYRGAAWYNNKLYIYGDEQFYYSNRIEADIFVRIYDTTTTPFTLVNAKWTFVHPVSMDGYNNIVAGGWNYTNNRPLFLVSDVSMGTGKPKVYEWNIDAGGIPTSQNGSVVTLQKTFNSWDMGAVIMKGSFGLNGAERYVHKSGKTSAGVTPQFDFFYTSATGTAGNLVSAESFAGDPLTHGGAKDPASNKILEISQVGYGEEAYLREWQDGDSIVSGTTNAGRFVGYTWLNSDGSKQSDIGGIKATPFTTRKVMKVTIGEIPVDTAAGLSAPTSAHVYVANQANAPTALTQWIKRATIVSPSKQAEITPGVTLSGNPPAANGFLNGGGHGEIRSTSGNSYWRGDDSAKFYQLLVTSNEDVLGPSDVGKVINGTTITNTMVQNNKPPLTIGPSTGSHLRIDGNEILSMDDNDSKGYLGIQGRFIWGFDFGSVQVTPAANGDLVVNHNLGVTPTAAVGIQRANGNMLTLFSKSSTSLTFRAFNNAGTVITGSARTIDWWAIAGSPSEPT